MALRMPFCTQFYSIWMAGFSILIKLRTQHNNTLYMISVDNCFRYQKWTIADYVHFLCVLSQNSGKRMCCCYFTRFFSFVEYMKIEWVWAKLFIATKVNAFFACVFFLSKYDFELFSLLSRSVILLVIFLFIVIFCSRTWYTARISCCARLLLLLCHAMSK